MNETSKSVFGTTASCRWCGMIHDSQCPKVKAIEFEGDGITVKRVEFFAPADYRPVQLVAMPVYCYPYYYYPQYPTIYCNVVT